MKSCLALILIPAFASAASLAASLANEPSYRVPRSATAHPETCAVIEMVKREGKPWASESTVQELKVQNWQDDSASFVLSENKNFVRHLRITESQASGAVLIRTQEKEEWIRQEEKWEKHSSTVQQTVVNQGESNLLIEVADGVSEIWSLRSYADGTDQVTERISRSPGRYSRNGRQVGTHIEVCRAHIFRNALGRL